MKKIFSLILLLTLFSINAFSQVEVKVKATSSTAADDGYIPPDGNDVVLFSFTEPVKIIVDVSEVPALTGASELFIWGFLNGCCGAPTNGDFCDSPNTSQMTQEGPNLWSFTFTSVRDYMQVGFSQAREAAVSRGRNPDETRFGFLVKLRNGCNGGQSGDMNIAFTGPVYVKQKYESFPFNFSQTDVTTVIYNQDLEDVAEMQNLSDLYLYARATLVGGGTKEKSGTTPDLKLNSEGDSRYTLSFIPKDFFELTDSEQIENITIEIRGASEGVGGGERILGKLFTLKN